MAHTIALVGDGLTGDRISKRLDLVAPHCTVLHVDPHSDLGAADRCDVAILAHGGPQILNASLLIERGTSVVSIADRVHDIRQLIDLHDTASARGVSLVAGAGMSPGLTELLARHLSSQLATCDEIHLAIHGTAGPECARQWHRSLSGQAVALREGELTSHAAGSGRELFWFPEPVGAYDCYRAELASPLLLHETFPLTQRITARVSANRRDRLTARLPMLSPPHREGGVGALRVEVRGSSKTGARVTLIAGIAELVATSAAATAAAFAGAVLDGTLPSGVVTAGDARLDTLGLLRTIERLGVRMQEFTGVPADLTPLPVAS